MKKNNANDTSDLFMMNHLPVDGLFVLKLVFGTITEAREQKNAALDETRG